MKRDLLTPPTKPAAASTEHAKEAALRTAMEKIGGYMLWYLEDCCGERHEAENLFQQLWVSVYQKFPVEKFDHLPLVRRRAYQIYVDFVRSRNTRSFIGYTDQLPEPDPVGFHREASTDREESDLKARFWDMFPGVELEKHHKDAFWLFHRYGFTVAEVADRPDVAPSTVHDWIRQVRTCCQNYLNTEDQS